MAARLVTVTVEELGRRSVQLNLAKVSNDRIFLEKRLTVVKKDLKKAEDEMKSFAQQNKAVKLDDQAKATIEGVAKLKAELASKEVQLSAKRTYQTDESPEVMVLVAAVDRLKKELTVLGGSGGGVGEGVPSVGNIPNLALEFTRRMREVKIQEAILEQLTKQYEMEKINENRDTSSLQILDTAVVPDRKSKPKRSLIVVLSTITAFFISILAAFFYEYLEKLPESDRALLSKIKRNLLSFR
jgi:tyrosine-protein kinase Etk/Wzc